MKRKQIGHTITQEEVGKKLKDIVYQKMNVSGRLIRKCKKEGLIFCNAEKASMNLRMKLGDKIAINLPEESNHFAVEPMNIDVLYEDEDILAVNKPPFLVVHPTKGCKDGTLANGLAYYFQEKEINGKIRFINRLDRDTSGIVLVAKNAHAQTSISEQMKKGTVLKKYRAIVEGIIDKEEGLIDSPVGKRASGDIRRFVMEEGKPSRTRYKVIKRYKQATVLELILETGRTHQIRAHMEHLGYPILGDELYGASKTWIRRQALHCTQMDFLLLKEDIRCTVHAPLPKDMKMCILSLEASEKA